MLKAVRCIETGEVFESVHQARKKYGTRVISTLYGRTKSVKGLHFEYIERE